MLKEEAVRNKRVRRIAEQRAELALLRRTPANRLNDVDKRRRNLSVRKIQGFFREISKRTWFKKKRKAAAARYRTNSPAITRQRAKKRAAAAAANEEGFDELTVKVDDESDDEDQENAAIEMSNARDDIVD